MYTIKGRAIDIFGQTEIHSKAKVLCIYKRAQNDLNILDESTISKSNKEQSPSVLNVKFSSLIKSELKCKQKASHLDKPAITYNNNSNTRNMKNAQSVKRSIINFRYIDLAYCKMFHAILVTLFLICSAQSILLKEQDVGTSNTTYRNDTETGTAIVKSNNSTLGRSSLASASGYLDKLDNLERSVAAVLIKVAYGTTSTTKRSIPDNSYILGLTTVATPLLTTLRYQSSNQATHNGARHRNYELDLERDHALPTSAPNADILKSNNNPTYPNPNRHHGSSNSGFYDRERHRHTMQYNSTPQPSAPNVMKKANGQPTIPMFPGDVPSYSPPSRSFFTPPLPPEYQNPFADKPTLRGTNNEGIISNVVPFNNRRPIPPPSLMPGHERIPFRPPDLAATIAIGETNESSIVSEAKKPNSATSREPGGFDDRKKALNTPSRHGNEALGSDPNAPISHINNHNKDAESDVNANKRQEVLPNIRRILGTNGKKGDIPAVLLRHVTQRPLLSQHQPPESPIVNVNNVESSNSNITNEHGAAAASAASSNINKSKQIPGNADTNDVDGAGKDKYAVTTPSAAAAIGEAAVTVLTSTTISAMNSRPTFRGKADHNTGFEANDIGSGAAAAAASAHTTWTWAWNVHIYLSVVLFTILSVYSLYKLVTYNKLTHLFAQSYFVYIHIILIALCIMRIIYLCIDAYNIHGTFPIFAAQLLLNLPATFLTVAFAVLILFLFLKSLNHKNNRYSALVRPLTVVVGCGVHVGLCITLHYVESYTLQNHQNYYHQQQQQHYLRRQQHQQQHQHLAPQTPSTFSSGSMANPPPPRVLSLICQIIYIFICLSLGLLYLYLYRILKRILRSKSQNYIHGYQNLSYAIHITIATALLFVLMAALQIFGAFCIASVRPLMSQTNISETDWMQWGYQFSLRLIEIAIITLISWVTGLKNANIGSNGNAGNIAINGDVRMVSSAVGNNGNGSVLREKHVAASNAGHHNSHSNVANFFLPCTSGSSQEQFETDYPAICNTNTNLHTYTMRTGKLIYDDSYALNSLTAGPSAVSPSGNTEYQLQEPMYQRPYDAGSIRSAINHNIAAEYASQSAARHQQQHQHPHYHHKHAHTLRAHEIAAYMSADYMTDATTDHYENPNFDLRASSTGVVRSDVGIGVPVSPMQKLCKNTVSSGSATASASGSGSGSGSGSSQQQILLLQSDSCYSEPMQESSSYDFNNFERPVFQEQSNGEEPWTERERDRERELNNMAKTRERKQKNKSQHDATSFEHAERRSSNSTNSCSSSNGVRYASYNSFERGGNYKGARKNGKLNSQAVQNPGREITRISGNKRESGAQTLAHSDRSQFFKRGGRNMNTVNTHNRTFATNDLDLAASVCSEMSAIKQEQMNQQRQRSNQYKHMNSDDEAEEEEGEEEADEEEDDVLSGSNVECTNLISNNEHATCIANDSSITTATVANKSQSHLHVQNNSNTAATAAIHQRHQSTSRHCFEELNATSVITGATTPSSASESMIVAEQGYLRFRCSIEDRAVGSSASSSGNSEALGKSTLGLLTPSNCNLSQICSRANGIDC